MQQPLDVALVGAGGYGTNYLDELLHNHHDRVRLLGVVDPYPEHCRCLDELKSLKIPFYADISEFFDASRADLIFISSPIQMHAPQTIASLAQGASVFCEKPLCATIQDAQRMAQAERQAGGFVGIGYQWSFSDAIQALKQDIMNGSLGQPVRLKSRVYWPRAQSYYERNGWAGRLMLDDGTWVLDSPAGNAAAHYLHNMLYVLGATRETSAQPATIQAELFRANPIQNYDTAALRCMTDQGVAILFFTTHACETTINPIFDYEFVDANVSYNQNEGADIIARFHDGRVKNYGNPFHNAMGKIWQAVDSFHTGEPLACGIEAATAHTLCINGAQESAPGIEDFPKTLLRIKSVSGSPLTYVENLESLLTGCYETNQLPSECGQMPWAVAGRVVDLRAFDHFPQNAG